MAESRCGILCSECKYQQSEGCSGCVLIEQPFWGACAVKSCCEGKQREHCGQCEAFPCEVLHQFAYDEKEGDNGKRIRQCALWKGEHKSPADRVKRAE